MATIEIYTNSTATTEQTSTEHAPPEGLAGVIDDVAQVALARLEAYSARVGEDALAWVNALRAELILEPLETLPPLEYRSGWENSLSRLLADETAREHDVAVVIELSAEGAMIFLPEAASASESAGGAPETAGQIAVPFIGAAGEWVVEAKAERALSLSPAIEDVHVGVADAREERVSLPEAVRHLGSALSGQGARASRWQPVRLGEPTAGREQRVVSAVDSPAPRAASKPRRQETHAKERPGRRRARVRRRIIDALSPAERSALERTVAAASQEAKAEKQRRREEIAAACRSAKAEAIPEARRIGRQMGLRGQELREWALQMADEVADGVRAEMTRERRS